MTSAPLLLEPLPVELMNTVWADRRGVHDALEGPGAVDAWLEAVTDRLELPTPVEGRSRTHRAGHRHEERLPRLRDALRRLAAEATGDPRPAATAHRVDLESAVAVLNDAAAAAPRWSALTWAPDGRPTRTVRAAATVGEAAGAVVAEAAIELFTAEEQVLRACLAPGCVLYFVKDHPRREWCSTACGNRARAARHYDRHRRSDA